MGELIAFRPRSRTDAEPAPVRDRPDDRPRVDPLWREVTGRVLREARHRREQTLAEVAARAGVSVPYLSEVERGVKEPSSEVLAAVAGALELTLADIAAATLRLLRPLDLTADRRNVPDPRPTGPVALVG